MNEYHWFLGWVLVAVMFTFGIIHLWWWAILGALAFGAAWWLVGNFPADDGEDPPEDIR